MLKNMRRIAAADPLFGRDRFLILFQPALEPFDRVVAAQEGFGRG